MPICNRCHKEEAKPGRKSCQACIDKATEATRKLHRERKANGLCIRCGEPLTDRRHTSCARCRKRDVGYRMTLYQKRRSAGLCADCGAPVSDGKAQCIDCRAKRRDAMREKRSNAPEYLCKQRDDFHCRLCGKEAIHLDAHHIDCQGRQAGRSHNPEPNNDLDNLITLCRSCHLQVTYAIKNPVDLSLFIELAEKGRESI